MFQQKVYGPSTSKIFLALAVSATFSFSAAFSLTVNASNQVHPFSYEADGNCYCTEFVVISDIAATVLPTPIGGQTVKQICERLGDGPGLILENGLYNHQAYSDAQCGNDLKTNNSEELCTNLDADGSTSCGTAGAKWDLKSAYTTAAESGEAVQGTAVADNSTTTSPATLSKLADSGIAKNSEPVLTMVESSFKAQPLATQEAGAMADAPEATSYLIRDGQHDSSYQPGIQLGMGNTYFQTSENSVISAESSNMDLSQEDILGFPEIESHPIPDQIIRKSGDISVISDNATLEQRQIIIIEQDGSARRMTQDEIARLPLAKLEDSEITLTEIAQTETKEPATAAAIANPDITVATRISNTDNVSKPIEIWTSSQDYTYIGLAPTGYDFGGAGVEVEASASNKKGFSLMGSAGVADEYSEASLGLGFYFAPFQHRTTDVVVNVGVETGQFDLGITDLEDTGGFIGGYIRTRPISRLELTGGGRLSSYFEGDTVFIASGAYRITPRINAFSKVEVGDNDQFSLGFRYFY